MAKKTSTKAARKKAPARKPLKKAAKNIAAVKPSASKALRPIVRG